jgi:hypothetical protein
MELTYNQKIKAYMSTFNRYGYEINFSLPANYKGRHILTLVQYDNETKEVITFVNFSGKSRIDALNNALKHITKNNNAK